MITAKCDKKGRVYLREALRSRYGDQFVIVEAPQELVLLPVPEDAVQDLADLGKALGRHKLADLKARIRARAKQEVGA